MPSEAGGPAAAEEVTDGMGFGKALEEVGGAIREMCADGFEATSKAGDIEDTEQRDRAIQAIFSQLERRGVACVETLMETHRAEKRLAIREQQGRMETQRRASKVTINDSKTMFEHQRDAAP